MNTTTQLTAAQLRHAADIQERIEALQKELSNLLDLGSPGIGSGTGGGGKRWGTSGGGTGRRKMSAAGRARIAAALRARWAAAKRAGRNAL